MKKALCVLLMASMTMSYAFGGQAKVTWLAPEKYTDIDPGNESRDNFKQRVFKEFNAIFSELAKELPDGDQMEITVTDLDLAGEVNRRHNRQNQDIRIVKEIYWPRIVFSYTVKNAKNELISSGKEDIKDMNFMSSIGTYSAKTSFNYEEKMLKDWFRAQQKINKFPSK
jgi:hypothetical protein